MKVNFFQDIKAKSFNLKLMSETNKTKIKGIEMTPIKLKVLKQEIFQ
jgi:hypothetical protein